MNNNLYHARFYLYVSLIILASFYHNFAQASQYGNAAGKTLKNMFQSKANSNINLKIGYINQTEIKNQELDTFLTILSKWQSNKLVIAKYALSYFDESYEILNVEQLEGLGSILFTYPKEYFFLLDEQNIIRYSGTPPTLNNLSEIIKKYISHDFASLDKKRLFELVLKNPCKRQITLKQLVKTKNVVCVFYTNSCTTCKEEYLEEFFALVQKSQAKIELVLIAPKELNNNSNSFTSPFMVYTIDPTNYDLYSAGNPLVVLFKGGKIFKMFTSKLEIYSDLTKFLNAL